MSLRLEPIECCSAWLTEDDGLASLGGANNVSGSKKKKVLAKLLHVNDAKRGRSRKSALLLPSCPSPKKKASEQKKQITTKTINH